MAKSAVDKGKRPKLMPVSDEMRHISALLTQELLQWPDVSARPMFGLRAFYRSTVIFALLPEKRALESPNAIAYKLAAGAQKKEGEKWRPFELENERDISAALAVLEKAYGAARHRPKS